MTQQLEQLISETIELTGACLPHVLDEDAPVLSDRTIQSIDEDSIYLVGLIGGKDVGKSSLVNALAGQQITEPTSHGPGTEHAIAYAHQDATRQVRDLLERELPGRYRVIVHSNDGLRRQVLLDLPDIDSHFAEHIHITRRMLRHVLYPIWIQSIEKYADLVPQQLLAKVAAGNDPANFVFCLNKVDQLLARESEAAARELGDDFARRIARTLGMSQRPPVHLISAIHPEMGDLPDLRNLLSHEKSTSAVRHSQELAGRRKDRTLLAWLDEQGLSERAEMLERLEREAYELLAQRVGQPLLERAIPNLLDDPAHRMTLFDASTQKRLARWPLVNVLDAFFSPILALIRLNLSSRPASSGRVPDAYLTDNTRTVASLLQSTFAQLQQTHPMVGELYQHHKLWDDLPAETASAELCQRVSHTLDLLRDTTVTQVAGSYGIVRPVFRWLLTIGAILWFPFMQPILEAWLQPEFSRTARELLFLAVQMIGVTYLLKNVTFLLIWFAALWLILRFDTQRRVNRLVNRWKSSVDPNDPLSLCGQVLAWLDELIEPIRAQRQKLQSIVKRTESLRADLHHAAAA